MYVFEKYPAYVQQPQTVNSKHIMISSPSEIFLVKQLNSDIQKLNYKTLTDVILFVI